MGAYSSVPWLEERTGWDIWEAMRRTVQAMDERATPYQGVLFGGFMLTAEGPKVLEYNCRFGDPETEVLLPRLQSDPSTLFLASARGELGGMKPEWRAEAAVTVVLASEGYPGPHASGRPIEGVDAAAAIDGVTVFHAGTARDDDGRLVTAGGRVLMVTGTAATLRQARERAYAGVDRIGFEGAHARRDIAARAAEEERA
jgi:phosphoribosylamine---glycine ligase